MRESATRDLWRERLEHEGVRFPPPFRARGLTLRCDGTSVEVPLSPDAEEIALSWARRRGSMTASDDPARARRAAQNFWADFARLANVPGGGSEAACDFAAVAQAHAASEPASAARPPMGVSYARVDGRRVPVGNASVGVPGVFVGRGAHSELVGRVRRRLVPEDVTLNLSKGARVPASPLPGHRWGRVVSRKSAMWLAKWKDPVTGGQKYVYLAPAAVSQTRDRRKFDDVLALRRAFAGVVRRNARNLRAADPTTRQLATCAHLVFELALRIGKPSRGPTRVFGASTLQARHVRVRPDGRVDIAFTGKDGVPYARRGWAPGRPEVAGNLADARSGKRAADRLFDRVSSPRAVNEYLAALDPRLTSKVVRTLRANEEFERALGAEALARPRDRPSAAKAAHQAALLHVADFCNHRTGRGFERLSVRTALANYLDPRTTFRYARQHGAAPGALMPRTLLLRFQWALSGAEQRNREPSRV